MNKKQIEFINQLHKIGIWRQELLSIIFNLRPCLRLGITKENVDFLKWHLKKLNLEMKTYIYPPAKKLNVLIGRYRKILERAKNVDLSFSNSDRILKLGKILGYPKCCVKEFAEHRLSQKNLPLVVLKSSSKKDKLDFGLNFLYSFETRILSHPSIELDRLTKIGYLGQNKYLISWVPCSFECRVTKNYAQKLSFVLKKHFFGYALELENYLKKLIIFFNDWEFLVLEGKIKKDSIYYEKVLQINNLIQKSFLEIVQKGNQIKFESNQIKVFKDNLLLKTHNKKARIFNFV